MLSTLRHSLRRPALGARQAQCGTTTSVTSSVVCAPLATGTRTNVKRTTSSDMKETLDKFHVTRSGFFAPNDPDMLEQHLETYEHPTMDPKKFVKTIHTPVGLYTTIFDTLREDFRNMEDISSYQQGMSEFLSETEKSALLDSLLCNMLFPKEASKYADKVTKATQLFPNCIYSHMHAGLGNYVQAKMKELGKVTSDDLRDAYRFIGYYRTGVMMEE